MSGSGSVKRNRTGYTFNNKATLLRSGHEFFNALENLIDNAVDEIHFQTYIFEDDETGGRIAAALIRAARRGVKIFLLLDAYGSNNLSEKFLETLKKEKIEFRWFGQIFKKGRFHISRRLHRKVIVADVFMAIVSGINVSDRYNDLPGTPAWLDFGILVNGEISAKLYLICTQSWLRIRFRRLSKKLNHYAQHHFQHVEPLLKIRVRQNDWKIGRSQAARSYYQLIGNAQESLSIVGGYFLPGRKALKLLRKAAERGVHIKLVVAQRSDVGVMRNAVLYLYDWLLRYGIHIYEYTPSNVHGKVIVADKKTFSVGSYDMNTLSTYSNIELNLDVDDELLAGNLNEELERIIEKDCVEITADTFRKKRRISGRIMQWFAYRFVKSLFFLSVWLTKKEKEDAYQ